MSYHVVYCAMIFLAIILVADVYEEYLIITSVQKAIPLDCGPPPISLYGVRSSSSFLRLLSSCVVFGGSLCVSLLCI